MDDSPRPVTAEDDWRTWSPPQRCPICRQDATVWQEPLEETVSVTGCACSARRILRIAENVARRRWRELGIPDG